MISLNTLEPLWLNTSIKSRLKKKRNNLKTLIENSGVLPFFFSPITTSNYILIIIYIYIYTYLRNAESIACTSLNVIWINHFTFRSLCVFPFYSLYSPLRRKRKGKKTQAKVTEFFFLYFSPWYGLPFWMGADCTHTCSLSMSPHNDMPFQRWRMNSFHQVNQMCGKNFGFWHVVIHRRC